MKPLGADDVREKMVRVLPDTSVKLKMNTGVCFDDKSEYDFSAWRKMELQDQLRVKFRRDCRPVAVAQLAIFQGLNWECGLTFGVTKISPKSRDVHWCVWTKVGGVEYLVDPSQKKCVPEASWVAVGKDHFRVCISDKASPTAYLYLFAKCANDQVDPTVSVLENFFMDEAVKKVDFLFGKSGVLDIGQGPDYTQELNGLFCVIRHAWKNFEVHCRSFSFHEFSKVTLPTIAKEPEAKQREIIERMERGEIEKLEELFQDTLRKFLRAK